MGPIFQRARTISIAREQAPGEVLLHPVALIAIALLVLNDHWLKALYPSWWTGKLSDVAGLAFFPLVLVALAEWIAAVFRTRAPRLLPWSIGLTALGFSAVKLSPLAAEAYRWSWGAMQWPVFALAALCSGRELPSLSPVLLVQDPTDLLALPALIIAWWLGSRFQERQT